MYVFHRISTSVSNLAWNIEVNWNYDENVSGFSLYRNEILNLKRTIVFWTSFFTMALSDEIWDPIIFLNQNEFWYGNNNYYK